MAAADEQNKTIEQATPAAETTNSAGGGEPQAAGEPAAAPIETADSSSPSAPETDPAAAGSTERTAKPSLLSQAGTEPPVEGEVKPATDAPAADAEKPAVEEPKTEEAKPAEKAAEAEAEKPAEVAPEAPAALPPIDYFAEATGLKLPEVLALDDAQRAELTTTLDAMRADPVKGAQALLDLHAKAMIAHDEAYARNQWDKFEQTRADWNKATMADDRIGGAGHQTAMADIAYVRDHLISDHKKGTPEYEKDRELANQFFDITGAGDHPLFLKMLHRMRPLMGELPMPKMDTHPTRDNGKPGGRGRLRDNYNHPTSQRQS